MSGTPEGHLAEELDEAAVGVVAEARVAGVPDLALQGLAVEAEVEDGVHHARHGHGRAGADRDQQRVGGVAEALAGLGLQGLHVGVDLVHDPVGQGSSCPDRPGRPRWR